MRVQSLSQEDALEEEMSTHSSNQPCLENRKDRGDWWFAVHEVAKSRTRLSTTAAAVYRNMIDLGYLRESDSMF